MKTTQEVALSKSRSGAPKRVAAGILAGALTVLGIALAPTAGAVDDVSGDRIAGINRYGTAAAVAGQDDFAGATTAILATGETFPDALAASGLAGANDPAPIILTQSDTYTSETQEALNNLTSVTDVIIVGGTAAVSQDVQDAVEADGFTVSRVAGNDRYETAAAIASESGAAGALGGLTTALVATGTGFADALAGGPLSYAAGVPILLVTPDSIPSATSDAIADLGIEQAVILGGTAAVSDDVAAQLEDATGNPSVRVAGVNRFATAAAVGEYEISELGWGPTEVLLASGLNFPDALSGGPLGGERNAPILLTASLPAETEAFLDDHSDTIADITALGGTGVIDDETLADAETAAEVTDNDDTTATNATATTRPELVSATLVETRTAAAATASRPAGTYVMYCFDESITGGTPVVDATNFYVYNGDGTRIAGTATETTSTGQTYTSGVSSTDNKCAEIVFGGAGLGAAGSGSLDTAAEAGGLTLATVELTAVAGVGGATNDGNIEGDAPLTPAGSSASAAGVTAAPDLVSVGNFRAGTTADVTAVDFTFDAAAFNQNVNGYQLIGVNGTTYPCVGPATGSTTASGQTAAGGEGTTVHTVTCAEPVSSVQHSADTIARGAVVASTVATTAGGVSPNPLEAVDVSNGGNSDAPDLALAVFAADAVANVDAVAYIFDEEILAAPVSGSGFRIYNTAGTQATSFAAARSSESNSAVTAFFADNTLSGATYVGASVVRDSVTEVPAAALKNANDEVGVSPSAGPTPSSAGTTDGPDLQSVVINTVTTPFGNTVYTATYTFDEDTADTAAAAATAATDNAAGGNSSTGDNVILGLLKLYLADGIQLNCAAVSGAVPGLVSDTTALTNRTEDTDNMITCSSFTVGIGGTAATTAQVHSAVVGTAAYGAVDDETLAGGDANPEGAAVTTGGNGTPAS
jgi:putative cell wall-binding protein